MRSVRWLSESSQDEIRAFSASSMLPLSTYLHCTVARCRMTCVASVVQGLALFQGGVLMISHDAHLIESTVDELWVIEGGTATPFHGSFAEYKRTLSA